MERKSPGFQPPSLKRGKAFLLLFKGAPRFIGVRIFIPLSLRSFPQPPLNLPLSGETSETTVSKGGLFYLGSIIVGWSLWNFSFHLALRIALYLRANWQILNRQDVSKYSPTAEFSQNTINHIIKLIHRFIPHIIFDISGIDAHGIFGIAFLFWVSWVICICK